MKERECLLCKGTGRHKEIENPKEKAEIARFLVKEGLPYGDIARILGWKSKNSVTHALKEIQTPIEDALYVICDAIEWGNIDQLSKRVEEVLTPTQR